MKLSKGLFFVLVGLVGWIGYSPCLNLGIPKESTTPLEKTSVFQMDLSALQTKDLGPFYEKLMEMGVDVFSMHSSSATILTQPATMMRIVQETNPNISFSTLVSNVSDFISLEKQRLQGLPVSNPKDLPKDWFKQYHRLSEIESFYKELEKKYPDRVRMLPAIGLSYEGRNITAISVTANQNESQSHFERQKPQFFIQGGIHAREWISHATLEYITYQLATSDDPAVTSLLEVGEFLIIPVMNPDGYVYAWEHNRLWRKNRRVNSDRSHGVDLNRNFNARWGHEGTSKVPSSETYCGKSAASEPEVKAVSRFFESNDRIIMALDIHSYSQLILRPVGWTNKDAPHEKKMQKIGKKMSEIIRNVNGKVYISEKSVTLYPTTGAAHDWFYMQTKYAHEADGQRRAVRPYAYTIELRPTAEWLGPGFLLDPSEIIPTGAEILPAVLFLAEQSVYHPLYTKQVDTETVIDIPLWLIAYFLVLIIYLAFHSLRTYLMTESPQLQEGSKKRQEKDADIYKESSSDL